MLFHFPGFCHQQCATTSTVNTSKDIDFLVICKQCCETQAQIQVPTQVGSSSGSPASPLLPRVPDIPKPDLPKDVNLECHKGSSTSLGGLEHFSEVKSLDRSTVTKKHSKLNWGLIWRKKFSEDTGFDFRLKNILHSGNTDRELMKPICRLCDQPYNGDVMYIRCEACKSKRNYKFFISDHYCLSLLKMINVLALCPWQIGITLML